MGNLIVVSKEQVKKGKQEFEKLKKKDKILRQTIKDAEKLFRKPSRRQKRKERGE